MRIADHSPSPIEVVAETPAETDRLIALWRELGLETGNGQSVTGAGGTVGFYLRRPGMGKEGV